jgi:5,10-methenyltetrahydromethanopterin hydrogenase
MLNTELINTAKYLIGAGYSEEYVDATLLSNGSYSVTEIRDAIKIAKGEKVDELINKEITDGNLFMKILIACGCSIDQLTHYQWFIKEIHRHEYHCTGYHPVASRIDIIKANIVVH